MADDLIFHAGTRAKVQITSDLVVDRCVGSIRFHVFGGPFPVTEGEGVITSLKLKLSKGNIKAVQGDTGHAEAKMVTDTYAHSFDADRKLIAQEMDSRFFSRMEGERVKPVAEELNIAAVKIFLEKHPELWEELRHKTE